MDPNELAGSAEISSADPAAPAQLQIHRQQPGRPVPLNATTNPQPNWGTLFGIELQPPDESPDQETPITMLEQLLKLYTMAMVTGVTSPMPHFVGPPGAGKSTVFRQLADQLGVRLHTINVSRINPMELEGVQMPDLEHAKLNLLHAPFWTQLKQGDIILFDEFLRGFPEVYNGLLDILTAREVAGFELPPVFIAGASNSVATYDGALEDRLIHIPVPDPRKKKSERDRLCQMVVDQLGINPDMATSVEMYELIDKVVLPTFDMLDSYTGTGTQSTSSTPTHVEGMSVRKLVGMAKLRQVDNRLLKEMLAENNQISCRKNKHQYVFLGGGSNIPAGYEVAARALNGNAKLTPLQQENLTLNLQLIEMDQMLRQNTTTTKGDADDDPFA